MMHTENDDSTSVNPDEVTVDSKSLGADVQSETPEQVQPTEILQDDSQDPGAEINLEDNIEKIKLTIELDQQTTLNENNENIKVVRDYQYWTEKNKELKIALEKLQDYFSKILTSLSQLETTLTPEVIDQLQSRRQGIELCEKMLLRAKDRMLKLTPSVAKPQTDFPTALTMDEIPEEIMGATSHEVQILLDKLYKSRRIFNNRIISENRMLSRDAEKGFLPIIERQILPIIDGLDEGKKLADMSFKKLITENANSETKLNKWLTVYDILINAILKKFTDLDIHPVEAIVGEVIDYELFDPLDSEEDSDMEDEQIKEMVRRGYRLKTIDGDTQCIIRPGQVVVVKNPSKEQ